MMFYAQQMDAEIGGLGAIRFEPETDSVYLDEIFLPKQAVKSAKCDLVPSGTEELFLELMAKGEDEKIAQINLSWHSHHTMPVMFSGEDNQTILDWPGKYFVALVINRKQEMKARLMSRVPVQVVGDINVEVNWNAVPEYAEWLQEMKDKVTVVSTTTAVVQYAGGEMYGGYYKGLEGNGQRYRGRYKEKHRPIHSMTEKEFHEMEGTPLVVDDTEEDKPWWDREDWD